MNSNRTLTSQASAPRRFGVTFTALGLTAVLAGCSAGLSTASIGVGTGTSAVHYTGSVHGGQQPIANAAVTLYAVSTAGPKQASTVLATTTTNANGQFAFIPGSYTCTGVGETYITAVGGNAGNGVNTATDLAAALGPCSSLGPTTFISINEVTTIAAAYALLPFSADPTHIGASGALPQGIVNAFGNAAQLADFSAGQTPGANLTPGTTVPIAEINTLADILAACVNSSGSASPQCTAVLQGTPDTFSAAMQIARTPGAAATTALYSQVTAAAPFQPTLSSQPNDFSVAVNSTVNGTLSTPYGLAIDATGNAWVTNESGTSVVAVGNSMAAVNSLAPAGLFGAEGVAIDRTGNVFIANTAGNSVIKYVVQGGTTTSTQLGGIVAPSAVAIDSAGNVFVANFNGNSVTGLNNTLTPLPNSPYFGNANIIVPSAIALSPAGNVYVTSGNGSVIELTDAGAYVAALNDGTLQAPAGVAIDNSGRILATGFTTGNSVGGALSQFTAAGAPTASSPATSAIVTPAGVATDGTTIFVANSVSGGALSTFLYGSSAPTSPGNGLGSLSTPVGVAIDASGSVWTANSGSNTVSKYVGLANTVVTPLAANVGP